jgi:LytS/YehU family sensor histidine kinase
MRRNKKNKELELELIYAELFDKMVELVLKTNEPQIVASTMMAQALRLYKTVFKHEGEFREVIETVLKQAEKTEPYNHNTLH